MQKEIYHALAKVGRTYWWTRGQQYLIRKLWETFGRKTAGAPVEILDVGCGAGDTLKYLSTWGEAWGVDSSEEALAACRALGLPGGRLIQARAERLAALGSRTFDLIVVLEVMEHLADPVPALREIQKHLKPNGLLIATAPADPKLWSERDVRLHHYKRYRRDELAGEIARSGLNILKSTHCNAFYYWPFRFYLAWRRRATGKATPPMDRDTFEVPPWLSAFLAGCLKIETRLILWGRLPFGVSTLVVARRPAETPGR